jgi:hypothetical protein
MEVIKMSGGLANLIYNETVEYLSQSLDFKVPNKGALLDYVIENYVREKEEVVENWVETMNVQVPSIAFLDWDCVVDNDNDYIQLTENLYLNIFWLTNDIGTLINLNLIKIEE